MLKVTIKGEVYGFDKDNYPLHLAIQLEQALGMSFGAYLEQLTLGSAKAVAGFTWAVLAANGHDIALADILSGAWPLNMNDIDVEDEDAGDPTIPSSPVTAARGSARSPRRSGTRPGRSPSSPSASSTP